MAKDCSPHANHWKLCTAILATALIAGVGPYILIATKAVGRVEVHQMVESDLAPIVVSLDQLKSDVLYMRGKLDQLVDQRQSP